MYQLPKKQNLQVDLFFLTYRYFFACLVGELQDQETNFSDFTKDLYRKGFWKKKKMFFFDELKLHSWVDLWKAVSKPLQLFRNIILAFKKLFYFIYVYTD